MVAFLQGAVNQWLAKSSVWYRKWRAEALSKQEQELKFLITEPTLLTLHFLHHLSALVVCFFLFGLFLFVPVLHDLMRSSPSFSSWFLYRPIPGTDPEAAISTVKEFTIAVGILSLIFGYVGASGISFGFRAYRRLYDNKKAEFKRNATPPEGKSTDADWKEFE